MRAAINTSSAIRSFVLGPRDGLELLESIQGAAGVIAYRSPGGRVTVAVSPSLAHAFYPVAP